MDYSPTQIRARYRPQDVEPVIVKTIRYKLGGAPINPKLIKLIYDYMDVDGEIGISDQEMEGLDAAVASGMAQRHRLKWSGFTRESKSEL